MNAKKESQELLLEYAHHLKSLKGLQILFLIDFTSMTLTHKLIESDSVKKSLLGIVKESALLFKKNPLDTAYLEGEERIFIKNLKDNHSILVLVSDKTPALGSIFRLLDQLV